MNKNEFQKDLNEKSEGQYIYNSDFLTSFESDVVNGLGFINASYPEQKWLVDQLIPLGGITCISGAPKVGKSLFTTNLAVCLIKGSSLFDKFIVVKSNVLYLGMDEPERLTNERFIKFLGGEGIAAEMFSISDKDLEQFLFSSMSVMLDRDDNIEALVNFCKTNKVEVIIIDSFRRIFSGDENESRTINKIQKAFKKFLNEGITIIFLHHHGKEGSSPRSNITEKLRGSSDILAMVDSALMIEKVSEKRNKLVQAALRIALPIKPFIYEQVSTDKDRI
jgi:RecA-family ATPase